MKARHIKTVILVFGLLYSTLHTLFRRLPQHAKREFNTVSVSLSGKTVSFRALRDSGNELYDPITNRPVLVCEKETLHPLFAHTLQTTADPYTQFCTLNASEGSTNRMRLIPCQTVTGDGLLVAFKPDKVTINGIEEPYLVAFAPKAFSPDASYQAIY